MAAHKLWPDDLIVALPIEWAQLMLVRDLRHAFVFMVDEIIANAGAGALPETFPKDYRHLTREQMLSLVSTHQDLLFPRELRPAGWPEA